MNKFFIGSIKDGYMFTNKLSGVSIGDIIFNYDKLGKKASYILGYRVLFESGHTTDYFSIYNEVDLKKQIDSFYGKNRVNYEITKTFKSKKHQGTGTINAKYRVVEVYECNSNLDYYNNAIKFINRNDKHVGYLSWHENKTKMEELGYKNNKYAIKCELIEECDMELNQFASWNKWNNYLKLPMITIDRNDDCFKLTKYTGLTRVVEVVEE